MTEECRLDDTPYTELFRSEIVDNFGAITIKVNNKFSEISLGAEPLAQNNCLVKDQGMSAAVSSPLYTRFPFSYFNTWEYNGCNESINARNS